MHAPRRAGIEPGALATAAPWPCVARPRKTCVDAQTLHVPRDEHERTGADASRPRRGSSRTGVDVSHRRRASRPDGFALAAWADMDRAQPLSADRLPPRRGLHVLFGDHHRRIDAMCQNLLGWAHTDNSRELAEGWSELEGELLDHIAAEEDVILPGYAIHAPVDANLVLADHARIRALLTPIGVDVELHQICAPRLQLLVDALAAHALSEDAAMYPWAEQHISLVAERLLAARIERWFARG